jgi:hypothetical protein
MMVRRGWRLGVLLGRRDGTFGIIHISMQMRLGSNLCAALVRFLIIQHIVSWNENYRRFVKDFKLYYILTKTLPSTASRTGSKKQSLPPSPSY